MTKKKWSGYIAVALILGLIVGCAAWQTAQGRMETITISFESVGMIAFPTVLAYLQQRELNGSLSGPALEQAKVAYGNARAKYIEAGNFLIEYLNGPPVPAGNYMAQVSVLLRQVAVILADLSGGKVEGQSLTLPKAGGN
jgi:hypothetical protein